MTEPERAPKVLIADDSPTVTEILSYLFTGEGLRVETAADGIEAIEQFYREPPDVVVLDIEMPRMNGYQVCRILKDDPEAAAVPVVILTSRDRQSDRFRGLSVGADAYIVKDLEDDQLLVTVRELISRPSSVEAARPAGRRMRESEILERVNRMLDHRLFIAGVVSRLQRINAEVGEYEAAVMKVVELFSSVFEFVVGGVLLVTRSPMDAFLSLAENYDRSLADELTAFLLTHAPSTPTLGSDAAPRITVAVHPGSGERMFPRASELKAKRAWTVSSRGGVIAVLGMGATAPLKFSPESESVLVQFLEHSATVLDNALLVKSQAETNAELSRTLRELKSTQAQLVQSEKLASIGQLTAGLVHEMNNPINFISGNIEHLKGYVEKLFRFIDAGIDHFSGEMPADLAALKDDVELDFIRTDLPAMIADIRLGLDRAQRIITDLKAFSSGDRSGFAPVDLCSVVESALNLLRYQWESSVKIERECDASLWVDCNEGQIGQVVMNLLTNAVRAVKDTGREGVINIAVRRRDEFAELEVRDNGTGIPPENMDKLFQPFFTTREVGEGMGLGLSITHGIVQSHGGKITVDSRMGEGSRFVVLLPVRHDSEKP